MSTRTDLFPQSKPIAWCNDCKKYVKGIECTFWNSEDDCPFELDPRSHCADFYTTDHSKQLNLFN
ncbi:MAG: hypothetical protein PHC61_00615 [Chitinivibrionales bacterium]|nr:hypothetical protein [Chitinivibrionales bacterium]